ncbi:hypothetical protein UlMin_000020 [Ulmus minor]
MEDTPAPDAGSMSSSSSAQGDGKTIKECEDMIRRCLRTLMVKFLLEHLEKSGCGIGDGFIKAVNCTKKIAGGYARGKGNTIDHQIFENLLDLRCVFLFLKQICPFIKSLPSFVEAYFHCSRLIMS